MKTFQSPFKLIKELFSCEWRFCTVARGEMLKQGDDNNLQRASNVQLACLSLTVYFKFLHVES